MKYRYAIEERKWKVFVIEANSEEEAEDIAWENYDQHPQVKVLKHDNMEDEVIEIYKEDL